MFENNLYDMQCIEFRQTCDVFQKQLARYIKQVKETDFVLVSGYKTRNMYKISARDYNNLLTENIPKTKSNKSDIRKINLEAGSKACLIESLIAK